MSKIEDLSDTIKRLHKELSQKNKPQLKDEVYVINSYDLYLILDASIYLYEKNADLEAKLEESDKELKLAQKLHTELFLSYEKLKDNSDQLKQQLAESEEIHKLLETQLKDMERSKLAWENKYFKLEKQLAEKEKEKIKFATKHLKEANRKIDELVGYSDYNVWEKFDQQIKLLKKGK